MAVSQALFFDDLELAVLRSTHRVFCRMFLSCDVSDVFSHRIRLWVFGRKITVLITQASMLSM